MQSYMPIFVVGVGMGVARLLNMRTSLLLNVKGILMLFVNFSLSDSTEI